MLGKLIIGHLVSKPCVAQQQPYGQSFLLRFLVVHRKEVYGREAL